MIQIVHVFIVFFPQMCCVIHSVKTQLSAQTLTTSNSRLLPKIPLADGKIPKMSSNPEILTPHSTAPQNQNASIIPPSATKTGSTSPSVESRKGF
jgi:hypothetical protein